MARACHYLALRSSCDRQRAAFLRSTELTNAYLQCFEFGRTTIPPAVFIAFCGNRRTFN